ncbi:hypothetical protein QCA50_007083 [Cerrena zonata]|uniref:Uncharacterized protein n=1 Tax=Cerrena zonata TaxID=2478898 RepID=A0AAW0GH82_9APHY
MRDKLMESPSYRNHCNTLSRPSSGSPLRTRPTPVRGRPPLASTIATYLIFPVDYPAVDPGFVSAPLKSSPLSSFPTPVVLLLSLGCRCLISPRGREVLA